MFSPSSSSAESQTAGIRINYHGRNQFQTEMQTLASLFLGYVALTHVTVYSENLKLIQSVFRHGDRSPGRHTHELYPLDPHANETWFPEGWDALTNDGKRRAHDLGVFYKQRYGNWLGDVYMKDNVKFISSAADRTIMTSQLVAAGLFPPVESQRWHSDINWQPIPVFSDPSKIDKFYYNALFCRKLVAMRKELESTDEFLLNRAKELNDLFELIGRNVGIKVGQEEATKIHQILHGQLSEKVELPEWTNGIFPEGQLKEVSVYDYVIQSYNKSMIQLNGGLWVREWLQNVDAYLNGTNQEDPKAFFYGAHELNIGAILVALGLREFNFPYYCSSLMFELLEVDNEFYVKVLYRNKEVLQELLVPGCGSVSCPLSTFRQLFDDIIITDEEVNDVC